MEKCCGLFSQNWSGFLPYFQEFQFQFKRILINKLKPDLEKSRKMERKVPRKSTDMLNADVPGLQGDHLVHGGPQEDQEAEVIIGRAMGLLVLTEN